MPKSEPPQTNKTGIPPWPHEQKLIFAPPSPQSAIAYLICCPARRCQQQCRPTPAGTDSGAGISQILLVQINQKRMSPPQTQTQPKRPAPKKLFAACLFRLSVALPLAPSSPFFPTNWPLTASHTHAHKHSRNTSSSDIFCLLLCGKPLTSGSTRGTKITLSRATPTLSGSGSGIPRSSADYHTTARNFSDTAYAIWGKIFLLPTSRGKK